MPHVLEHSRHLSRNGGGTRNHQVGVSSSWPHVPLGHGSDRGAELFDYRLRSAASLPDIAIPAPLEANSIRHLDIHSCPQQSAQLWPVECEQAFDDHNLRWLKQSRFAGASVNDEIVRWNFDGLAEVQVADLGNQQLMFERRRFIKVRTRAVFQRKIRQVAVVVIEWQHLSLQVFC